MAETFIVEGSLEDIYQRYIDEGWSDGLPMMPPTDEAVMEMLRFTDRSAEELMAALPPNRTDLTVAAVAVNAVMAGCRPEYFPVVLAAIEAIAEPDFNLYGIQATTNPVAVMIMVNGPIAGELAFNGAGNCLGPGVRANATVGRAVRLAMINIGGSAPQTMDKSTAGSPGKYTMCIAENEDMSPWEPYHVERGFEPEVSTVSAFSTTGTQNILDLASRSAWGILRTFASSCATVGHQNVQLGGGPTLMLCPEHADILAADGFSKDDVRRALYETSRVRVEDFPPETLKGMVRHRRARYFGSEHPKAGIPLADSPEEIQIIVAGGPGPHSIVMPSFGEATTVPIIPITTKSGDPIASVFDFIS